MMRRILLLGLTSYVFSVSAQTPTASFADWKDNADGAYTIIHDDYGDTGVDGIWMYADTICHNRGIKFTFGAIAGSCESTRDINGYNGPYIYARDVMMAQHYHEIMSHSHNHNCAVGNAGWSPCDATSGSWGEVPGGSAFEEELYSAHQSILNGTGFASKYYIFPYDRFTNAANDRLKELGYLGSRTGWDSPYGPDAGYIRNGYENSDLNTFFPDSDGFYRTSVQVFNDVDAGQSDAGQVSILNGEVDNAINSSMWANRELHNVGNTGWGNVSVNAYRSHIDYLRTKVESGELWVPTVSEILTYQMQKLKFTPNINYSAAQKTATVDFTEDNSSYTFTMEEYLTGLEISSPITLIVDMGGSPGDWIVSQDGFELQDVNQVGNVLYINCFPHQGSLFIYENAGGGNVTPIVSNSIPDYDLIVNFNDFIIDLKDVFSDVETIDDNLIFAVTGNSEINVDIVNGIATVSVNQDWSGTETLTFSAEDEGGLKVNETSQITVTDIFQGHTPYNGTPIVLPGRLEIEEYDEGIEGVVFYEITTSWEPNPANNPFRPGDDVDIAANGSGYIVGYTESTEWLDYTVDIAIAGQYEFLFNIAQDNDGSALGLINVYIDGDLVINSFSSQYTADWDTYVDKIHSGMVSLPSGQHILRIEFERGSVDVDFVDVYASPLALFDNSVAGSREIYPNPTKDIVNLTGDQSEVQIINQLGEVVLQGGSTELNVSGLTSGIYTIQVEGEFGAYQFVKE